MEIEKQIRIRAMVTLQAIQYVEQEVLVEIVIGEGEDEHDAVISEAENIADDESWTVNDIDIREHDIRFDDREDIIISDGCEVDLDALKSQALELVSSMDMEQLINFLNNPDN